MILIKNKILYFFQLLVISANYIFNKDFNERKIIKQYVQNNGIVFDVGSNIGSFFKFVSKSLKGKSIHIHSFEPGVKSCEFQKILKYQETTNCLLIIWPYLMEKVGKLNFMKDQLVHTHQHFLSHKCLQ